MAKVRIHVLAKELEIQSKDIIGFLAEKNIEVKSVQSSVEDDVIEMVRARFAKKQEEPKADAKPKKKAEAKPEKKA